MLLYFEFEERRRRAEVTWPKHQENIAVQIIEKDLLAEFPGDLYYMIEDGNKVTFSPEDPANERLLELQTTIKRRLQELVSKS